MTESPLVVIVLDLIIEKHERNKTRRKDIKEDIQPDKEKRPSRNTRNRDNKFDRRGDKTKKGKNGIKNKKIDVKIKSGVKIGSRKK